MQITIFGTEYPMEYTIGVQKKMQERFGGIESEMINAAFSTDWLKTNENTIFMVAAMIEAGIARRRAACDFTGTKYEGPEKSLTEEELLSFLDNMNPGEINQYFDAMVKTMAEGNKKEVELKEEKKRSESESK